MRFARLRDRAREKDPVTFEEFCRLEAAENSTSPLAQQLEETGALADRVISNGGSLEELARRVKELVVRESGRVVEDD